MLIELPEGKGPGTWTRVLFDGYTDHPRYSAMICCPSCKRYLNLVNHTIAPDGQVSPSVGHPKEYPPCPYHTYPRLIGWSVIQPPVTPIYLCALCHTSTRDLSGWSTWQGKDVICPACLASRK